MKNRKLTRKKKTIRLMVSMYCEKKHNRRESLCPACGKLLEYAILKLDNCPLHGRKPVCVKCRVHCYSPAMRGQIRKIMRFAGPRMIFRHPFLAVCHLWDRLSR